LIAVVAGPPGIGKTTLVKTKPTWVDSYLVVDADKFGYRETADENSAWLVNWATLKEFVNGDNAIVFVMAKNWHEYDDLNPDLVFWLKPTWSWEVQRARLLQRIKEKKNTWPRTPEQWATSESGFEKGLAFGYSDSRIQGFDMYLDEDPDVTWDRLFNAIQDQYYF